MWKGLLHGRSKHARYKNVPEVFTASDEIADALVRDMQSAALCPSIIHPLLSGFRPKIATNSVYIGETIKLALANAVSKMPWSPCPCYRPT